MRRTLLFRPAGVELLDRSGRTVWASDSDPHFRRRFPELTGSDDAEEVINYLVERGVISGVRKTVINIAEQLE